MPHLKTQQLHGGNKRKLYKQVVNGVFGKQF